MNVSFQYLDKKNFALGYHKSAILIIFYVEAINIASTKDVLINNKL